ncbi:BLOC-2 complex member HPS3 [Bacillus rossius redtenbacheri]|uniref:BLOC-2 complex member HPS3 n=1 Tax=Bacillus rossius redtenbacheri TaxID=93214 RepID=UPI002FDC9EC5
MGKMVRVISVHHFASQDIQTCEEPVAVTSAPPNRILVALSQHLVEVRDLAAGGDVIFTFPTVDRVHQMLHCRTGNYVATLEKKQSRQGRESMYARIYANWDVISDCNKPGMQPMRARIAGRVTPSSMQSSVAGLEMIELPVKMSPSVITCCQATGSILLSSENILMMFNFCVRTHDISHLKFIDFEESCTNFTINFVPMKLALCNNIVVAMGKECLHVFQVGGPKQEVKHVQKTKKDALPTSDKKDSKKSDSIHVDWNELLQTQNCIKTLNNASYRPQDSKLHPNSYPLVALFPSIAADREVGSGVMHRNSPFQVAPPDMTVNVVNTSPTPLKSEDYQIFNMLQIRLASLPLGGSVQEDFHCLQILPLYIREDTQHAVNLLCLVTTQQEGYLYHFALPVSPDRTPLQQAACVTVYPFTAPASCVALEPYVLHVFTDTGLETYTLRAGYQLAQRVDTLDNIIKACPSFNEPVCLVGLRPFFGVEHLLVTESYLALLACSEGSSASSQDSHSNSWTLYSLRLPTPATLYSDMIAVGSLHRWTSPTTYYHLLNEGHIILRSALDMGQQFDKETILQQYKESCCLLGDYYITSENEDEWKFAMPYYTMSNLTPIEVVDRVKNIDIPAEALSPNQVKSDRYVPGLMSYLKTYLLRMDCTSGDTLFSPAVPSFAHTLLDLFEEHDPGQVSTLVLRSSLLREYATDRVLSIMKKQLSTRPEPEASDALALVLLCIQKGSPEQACAVLDSLSSDQLSDILTVNYQLIIESGKISGNTVKSRGCSFTELSSVLIETKPDVVAQVLFNLVAATEGALTLQQVLQVFLEYLPSRISIAGSATSLVVQDFLERYFLWFYKNLPEPVYDPPTVEALKILVRSYLSNLQCSDTSYSKSRPMKQATVTKSHLSKKNVGDQTIPVSSNQASEKSGPVLFLDLRSKFLDKMPPFAADLCKRLVSPHEIEKEDVEKYGNQIKESLIKLQSLLCSKKLPKECIVEVYQFLHTHPQLLGNLSLQVLCVTTKEATTILLDFCPQALLQYSKDRYKGETEWKHLLSILQKKVQLLPEEGLMKPFYMQVQRDVLMYLAQNIPLDDFCHILPSGGSSDESYQSYIRTCQQVGHANHIQALIMATGQQLLTTLNL